MAENNILRADSRAKALIFDLDGTLMDSMPMHWAGWQSSFRHFGTEVDHDFFFSNAGKAALEIAQILIDKYSTPATPQQIVDLKQNYVYQHVDDVAIIDPVVNVVNDNYGRIPMAVGTGSDASRAIRMLRNVGLLEKFDCIVSADDVANHKPHPDTFLLCAERMGVDPSLCEVFEDAEPGFEAACRAGMMYVDVKPYYQIYV